MLYLQQLGSSCPVATCPAMWLPYAAEETPVCSWCNLRLALPHAIHRFTDIAVNHLYQLTCSMSRNLFNWALQFCFMRSSTGLSGYQNSSCLRMGYVIMQTSAPRLCRLQLLDCAAALPVFLSDLCHPKPPANGVQARTQKPGQEFFACVRDVHVIISSVTLI